MNSLQVELLGIKPQLIDNLHAKASLNESVGIFSSMNLSEVSAKKSIDLAYITETINEYNDLRTEINEIVLTDHKTYDEIIEEYSKREIPESDYKLILILRSNITILK